MRASLAPETSQELLSRRWGVLTDGPQSIAQAGPMGFEYDRRVSTGRVTVSGADRMTEDEFKAPPQKTRK